MLYELAKLTLQIGSTPRALAGIKDFVTDKSAKGTLLGCWASEIGELNQVAVLRGFSDVEALRVERKRVLESSNPFGCSTCLPVSKRTATPRSPMCRRSRSAHSVRSTKSGHIR